ncbi:hypothetical protein CPAV1605_443 [seawater metagenome]|uniref:Uncharacterized protein n=1 Tax=seawater metagenome TaxID=1561972 RepID=A0A5E8CH21_9ZZZZ
MNKAGIEFYNLNAPYFFISFWSGFLMTIHHNRIAKQLKYADGLNREKFSKRILSTINHIDQ